MNLNIPGVHKPTVYIYTQASLSVIVPPLPLPLLFIMIYHTVKNQENSAILMRS